MGWIYLIMIGGFEYVLHPTSKRSSGTTTLLGRLGTASTNL